MNHRPRSDDELHAYIAAFYGIFLPRVDVCPGHTAPFNVWKELFFRRVNDGIIVGSRESGKTLGYALLDHLQMGHDGADIANAGAIEAQALKCYSYIEGFSRLPWFKEWLLKAPMLSKTYFKNGGFLEVLPMTMGRLNSPHPNIANFDEIELTTWKLVQEGACAGPLTMVACEHEEKRIPGVSVGDRVWAYHNGRFELRSVLRSGQTGIRETILIGLSNGRVAQFTPDHLFLTEDGWREAGSLKLGQGLVSRVWRPDVWGESDAPLGVSSSQGVFVVSISPGATVPVYDLTIEGVHNFVAEGVVVHNSMPIRKGEFPPAIRYTSSRKKAYGPLEQLLSEAPKRGLKTWTWCVLDVAEECKPDRHKDGVGCRGVLKDGRVGDLARDSDASDWEVYPCALRYDCLMPKTTDDGTMAYEDGPGRLTRARGFFNIDDIIRQKKLMDKDTWLSQWLSLRPMVAGLIYPTFDTSRHVFAASEWGGDFGFHEQLPVYGAIDPGYTNPWAMLWMQVTPTDELIIFAEDYETQLITQRWADRIKGKPWYKQTSWIVVDPAAADERATLSDNGIPVLMADNEVDRGIKRVRYLLDPPDRDTPMLYISEACVNLISEMQKYHVPEVRRPDNANEDEEPEKVFDHAADAMRYAVTQLYGNRLKI